MPRRHLPMKRRRDIPPFIERFPGEPDGTDRLAGLFRSGDGRTGNRQSFAALVAAFETLFNVTLPKPYDLRADLARRKKNLSVLLPKLRETYEKNTVNCGIDRH